MARKKAEEKDPQTEAPEPKAAEAMPDTAPVDPSGEYVEDYDSPPTMDDGLVEHELQGVNADRPDSPQRAEEAPTLAKDDDDPNRVLSVGEVEANQAVETRKGDLAPQQPEPRASGHSPNVTEATSGQEPRGEEPEGEKEPEYIVAVGKLGPFIYGERVKRSQFAKNVNVDGHVKAGNLSVPAN